MLRASRITYDEAADEIRAEGPIVLTDPDGGVLLADAAALTPDLTEGLISSARLLIAGQAAARRGRGPPRSGERYATLDKVVASTCTICAGDPTPTWAIRASRVTRDAEERRLYFQNARVELFGLPVGYAAAAVDPRARRRARRAACWCPASRSPTSTASASSCPTTASSARSADATVTPFVTTQRRRPARGRVPPPLRGRRLRPLGRRHPRLSLDGHPGRGAIFADGAFRLARRLRHRLRRRGRRATTASCSSTTIPTPTA